MSSIVLVIKKRQHDEVSFFQSKLLI